MQERGKIGRGVKLGLPIVAGVLLAGFLLARRAGAWLVVDQPRASDALVVLGGDLNDARYWKGVHLLQAGMARTMIYDVPNNTVAYGQTQVQLAQAFVARTAGRLRSRIQICPLWANSTADEAANVVTCLEQTPGPVRRMLLVTSDYHTRRAFAVFRARLPQFQWSVAAAHDPYSFGVKWWQRRAWAKTCAGEWERLLWWELVDRWAAVPLLLGASPRAPVGRCPVFGGTGEKRQASLADGGPPFRISRPLRLRSSSCREGLGSHRGETVPSG